MGKEEKKRFSLSAAWLDARDLVWAHRYRLALGMLLMLANRLVGLVLPASSKYLIDNVVVKHQAELLIPLAIAAGAATLVQATTSFTLTQVLGIAAQRAITDMRKNVEEHVARLPIRYFDSTQTGMLISRIMTDAEGIRNLVGTGLVQLTGSLLTSAIALVVLFYLNWRLTGLTLLFLAAFVLYGLRKRPALAPGVASQRCGCRRSGIAGRHSHRQSLCGGKTKLVFARRLTACSAMFALDDQCVGVMASQRSLSAASAYHSGWRQFTAQQANDAGRLSCT